MYEAAKATLARYNQNQRNLIKLLPIEDYPEEVPMKFAAILTLAVAAFVLSGTVRAESETLIPLAETAITGSESESAEAIKKLRASGPEGLRTLFNVYSAEIIEFRKSGTETEKWRKIAAAIDEVAMQKDAYASGLYWYTDLNEARKAAAEDGKPILTLRLLGNLNEEFSCANSRLFRSLLYANAEVSKYLRDNYILHWKSVRPAPRITIDFGDGRKIERTITGNSIHYVLDDDGRIIEAIPGLYSPKAFMIYLTQAKQVNDAIDGKDARQQDVALMRYRKLSYDRLKNGRDAVIKELKIDLSNNKANALDVLPAYGAAPVATAKMMVTDEFSLLRFYDVFMQYADRVDFGEWQKLADRYSPATALDDATTAFVRRQTLKTGLTAAEFDKMFAKLRSFVGLDTTRNDFLYHTQLYSKLNIEASGNRGKPIDIEAFNSWVYAELFKTPDSDKWLGLYSTDVYTALDGNGITK